LLAWIAQRKAVYKAGRDKKKLIRWFTCIRAIDSRQASGRQNEKRQAEQI